MHERSSARALRGAIEDRARRPRTRLWLAAAALGLLTLGATSGRPAQAAPGAGLRAGRRSLSFGLSAGSEGTLAVLGLGYHLNPYVEVGGTGAVSVQSRGPDTAQLGPYVKLYPLPRPPVAPFLHLATQRLFVEDTSDGFVLHAGVGLLLFLGPHFTLSGELYREQVRLPDLGTTAFTDYHIGAGFLF